MAIVSVIHLSFLIADFAFGELYEGFEFFWKIVLLPNFSTLRLLRAIFFCLEDQSCLQCEINLLNSSLFTFVEGVDFSRFFGKVLQNDCGGGLS